MKIIIVNKEKEVAKNASKLVLNAINNNSNLVLGLSAGKTMIPFYKELVNLFKKKKINFSNIKTFNLDEYIVLNSLDKNSLRYFMDKNFFDKVNIQKKSIFFLDGTRKDIEKMCHEYETKIKKAGGIDLQILGIGRNGHIGFNEPGSSFKSQTRKVKLSETTRKDNSIFFKSIKDVPKYTITIGIDTIMKARKIILLANGKQKAKAIEKTVKGKVSTKVPASILQKHKDAILIIDKEAARALQ